MKLANGNYIRSPNRYSWWLRQGRYVRYMMRELSSLFIGVFSVMMVWGLYRLSQGETAFTAFTDMFWSKSILVLSVLMFLFAAYHSYSWFSVTPQAMPLKMGGKRIAAGVIIGAHMLLWLACSVAVWAAFVYGGTV